MIDKSVLITGSTGMLGKDFYSLINKKYRKTITLNRIDGNLLNPVFISEFLDKNNPDIIIHCIADTNVARCEKNKEQTLSLHRDLTDYLSRYNAKFVYISTDAVINPTNFYAESKLLGEKIALKNNQDCIVVRCNMYGINSSSKNSLFEWAYKNLKKSTEITGYTNVIFNAVYTKQIVFSVEKIIQSNFKGIINVGGNYSISKYEFLKKICEVFEFDTKLVHLGEIDSSGDKKINDTTLNVDVLNNKFDIELSLDEGLKQLRRDFYDK